MIFPVRWLLGRLKRTALLLTLTSSIFIVVCTIFFYLNSDPTQTFVSRLSQRAAESRLVGDVAAKRRPMVQFYPDNQIKQNYRKAQPAAAAAASGGEWGVKTEKVVDGIYEEVVKGKVAGDQKEKRYDQMGGDIVSYDVHIFYYAWYGSPQFNDKYYHWNHKYLEAWNKNDKKTYPDGFHDPDNDDIGANFYPELGAYSSKDPAVLSEHMKQIKLSGAGVVAVSWYPPGLADENGPPSDGMILPILEAAAKEDLKVTLHIEPYADMNVENLRDNIQYVVEHYVDHPAFYTRRVGHRDLPLYYIYDSYRIVPDQWLRLLSSKGDVTVRGTDLDGLFIGLLVEFRHRVDIKRAKFDGFYTYFGSNGFSHGSSWKNWRGLQDYAQRNSLLFIPSIGPGYVDTRIRPWNGQTTRERRRGSYYGMGWRTALNFNPKCVSITSFNEWHEGTQIESAIPKDTRDKTFSYQSYEPDKPDYYLLETRSWVVKFLESKKKK